MFLFIRSGSPGPVREVDVPVLTSSTGSLTSASDGASFSLSCSRSLWWRHWEHVMRTQQQVESFTSAVAIFPNVALEVLGDGTF